MAAISRAFFQRSSLRTAPASHARLHGGCRRSQLRDRTQFQPAIHSGLASEGVAVDLSCVHQVLQFGQGYGALLRLVIGQVVPFPFVWRRLDQGGGEGAGGRFRERRWSPAPLGRAGTRSGIDAAGTRLTLADRAPR